MEDIVLQNERLEAIATPTPEHARTPIYVSSSATTIRWSISMVNWIVNQQKQNLSVLTPRLSPLLKRRPRGGVAAHRTGLEVDCSQDALHPRAFYFCKICTYR